jgi:hypothetical protein
MPAGARRQAVPSHELREAHEGDRVAADPAPWAQLTTLPGTVGRHEPTNNPCSMTIQHARAENRAWSTLTTR